MSAVFLNSKIQYGPLAQLGERQVRNLEVRGSIPLWSTKRDKQAETSLFVSFYPTNNRTNAVFERIYKEIRSIFILKANPKQSAENIRH